MERSVEFECVPVEGSEKLFSSRPVASYSNCNVMIVMMKWNYGIRSHYDITENWYKRLVATNPSCNGRGWHSCTTEEFSYSGGWSPNWVHRHRGHLLSYCACSGWLWGWRIIRWNEDWQGKPKYSEKTCQSATLSRTNPTWPDPGSNPGRRGGKPATNRLSYGAALQQKKLSLQSLLNIDTFTFLSLWSTESNNWRL
jgi:hypothetical protein